MSTTPLYASHSSFKWIYLLPPPSSMCQVTPPPRIVPRLPTYLLVCRILDPILAFSMPALPCPALPCPALPCPALPCPALPCPALPCPALPCPALPCPALPCPALPCPALHRGMLSICPPIPSMHVTFGNSKRYSYCCLVSL